MTALDHRFLIQEELNSRKKKNPAYSLRALSRDSGVSQPLLSQILAGKRGLSHTKAHTIAARLGWNKKKARLFAALSELPSTSDPAARATLLAEIRNSAPLKGSAF